MESFTPISAALGGALIGLSASLLLIVNGRVAGISGILGGLLQPARNDIGWRLAFVAGPLLAPLIYTAAAGVPPRVEINASAGLLIMAGLLVGVGTRLGTGCTSGHGLCGIGRGSPRSIAATAVFMATAVLTVFVAHYLPEF